VIVSDRYQKRANIDTDNIEAANYEHRILGKVYIVIKSSIRRGVTDTSNNCIMRRTKKK
jgi:hypothetical protein